MKKTFFFCLFYTLKHAKNVREKEKKVIKNISSWILYRLEVLEEKFINN
jgi:hypothetical protein